MGTSTKQRKAKAARIQAQTEEKREYLIIGRHRFLKKVEAKRATLPEAEELERKLTLLGYQITRHIIENVK